VSRPRVLPRSGKLKRFPEVASNHRLVTRWPRESHQFCGALLRVPETHPVLRIPAWSHDQMPNVPSSRGVNRTILGFDPTGANATDSSAKTD
jgi:hypothetical protein